MSSPEVEKFEITQDDLENEFNPNRRTFRQTKHQAIYGMWADDDSDDERPSFSRKRGGRDYTAPMSFVSGGVKVGDKVTKEGMEDDIVDSESDEEPPMTMGFGGQKKRGGFRGSAFRGKKPVEDDVGGWQKHTKGVAQKIMEKMGFSAGKGLGKNLQGISTPVEASVRKGKGTIGFYGSERTERSLIDYPVQDKDEEEEQEFREKLQQWKKGDGEKKKKPKYVYKTAEELIAHGGSKKKAVVQSELAKVKVIDMTGKEKRVLSGYHALSHRHSKPEEEEEVIKPTTEKRAFDMPELLHNLDLLVDMAEDDIIQNNKKLQYEQDLIVNLKHEGEKLADICIQEEKQINRLTEIFDIVKRCEARSKPDSPDPLTLGECAVFFKRIQNDFYEEYKIYELSSLAVAMVFPLMKTEFEGWQPLQNPRHGMITVKIWKEILEDPNRQFSQGEGYMDSYERLIWEVWMPHIRRMVGSQWSPRDCDPLIEVLEVWLPLLPPWVVTNILDQLVMPRLQTEVDNWNPLTDVMPIHAWMHPWLPLMGDRLQPLYAPIRHKLANALNNWHPSDPSAKMILEPWQPVFTKGHMDAFLVKNIVPKLAMCLQEFVINPHQQHLDPWNWAMNWLDFVPHLAMVDLLDKTFFPKWHQVLCAWLSSNPNYDQVTKWYMGWKSIIPERLLAEPTIKDQFNRALDIMNRAVTGHYQPGARENVAYLTSTERRREYEAQATHEKRDYEAIRGSTASTSVPSSFKDLIEKKAEENGIIFMPISNKTYEAKQVYKFGKVNMYLDRGVIFVHNGAHWVPVSLQNLIDRGK